MDEATVHQAMAQALVERGLMTSEEVAADRVAMEAKASGEPAEVHSQARQGSTAALLNAATQPAPAGDGGADAVDPASPESLDVLVFQGPASPGAYNFGAVTPGVPTDLNQEVQFRSFMHAEQIPAGIGNELGRRWNEAAARAATGPALTDYEVDQRYQACSVELHRQWGADFDRNLKVARAEVARMAARMPNLVELLERSGLGDDPWVVSAIFNLAKARGRG